MQERSGDHGSAASGLRAGGAPPRQAPPPLHPRSFVVAARDQVPARRTASHRLSLAESSRRTASHRYTPCRAVAAHRKPSIIPCRVIAAHRKPSIIPCRAIAAHRKPSIIPCRVIAAHRKPSIMARVGAKSRHEPSSMAGAWRGGPGWAPARPQPGGRGQVAGGPKIMSAAKDSLPGHRDRECRGGGAWRGGPPPARSPEAADPWSPDRSCMVTRDRESAGRCYAAVRRFLPVTRDRES
jgi:hypothetical protein